MARAEHPPTDRNACVELAVFLALLVPTLVVLVAADVSLTQSDLSMATPAPVQPPAACEPSRPYGLDEEGDADR